jgi:hypothetical protein
LYDNTCYFQDPAFGLGRPEIGFAIDFFVIKALFKGDMQISFYADEELKVPVYSTTIASPAK